MFKDKNSIKLIFVLVILASMACTTMNSIQKFVGDDGEAQDASQDQWTDLSEVESPHDDQSATEADIVAEEPESFDTGGAQENPAVDTIFEYTKMVQQMESGDVDLELIEVISEDTQGEIIEVTVTNQSGEELLFEIPAGLVFTPVGTDEQNLMVLDAVVVTLETGETIIISPYVVCIEASATIPSSGSAYQIGYLASDDLLAFAECVDKEVDGTLTQDDIGLQFAVWLIADGGNVLEIPELTEEEGGALSELMEEMEANPDMKEMMEEMMLVISADWLQRCGYSVGGEE